jgi:hypothetical protein
MTEHEEAEVAAAAEYAESVRGVMVTHESGRCGVVRDVRLGDGRMLLMTVESEGGETFEVPARECYTWEEI